MHHDGWTARRLAPAFLGLLLVVSAACAGTSAPAPITGAQPASGAAAPQPKRGGTLIFGTEKDLSNSNPFVNTSSVPQSIKEMVYESLLAYDIEGRGQPSLAERYEVSPDARVFTFSLRKGVKFHNGQEMTADDVIWSAGYASEPTNGAQGTASLNLIRQVDKVDDYTVRFTLAEPGVAFLAHMSEIRALPIVPAKSLEPGTLRTGNNPPPGTGPFRFVEWRPDDQVTMERNDDYWDGAPFLDRIVFKLIPDPSVRFTALRAGDIQAAERIPIDWAERIDRGEVRGIKMYPARISDFRRVVFNFESKMVQDVRLREAVILSIDRDAYIQEVLLSYGQPTEVNAPPDSVWSKSVNLPPRKRDLVRSRQLLTEAGYNGEQINLIGRRGHEEIMESIVPRMQEAGLNLKVEILESRVYDERQAKGAFDITLRGGNTDNEPSVGIMPDFYSEFGPERGRNYAGYKNPEVDRLFDQLGTEVNQDRRISIFRDVMRKIYDDAVEYDLAFGWRFFATRDNVRDFLPTDNGGYQSRSAGLKKTWID
ncbi:MAG: hypothetical protein HW416_2453 [Chloroflexi bacterium]|nr:hypothetical protein [Chloroflexota bacterium]